jgi:hypothetical protein
MKNGGLILLQKMSGRNQGKFFHTIDEDGDVASSIFIIWDDRSAYYLIGWKQLPK